MKTEYASPYFYVSMSALLTQCQITDLFLGGREEISLTECPLCVRYNVNHFENVILLNPFNSFMILFILYLRKPKHISLHVYYIILNHEAEFFAVLYILSYH